MIYVIICIYICMYGYYIHIFIYVIIWVLYCDTFHCFCFIWNHFKLCFGVFFMFVLFDNINIICTFIYPFAVAPFMGYYQMDIRCSFTLCYQSTLFQPGC